MAAAPVSEYAPTSKTVGELVIEHDRLRRRVPWLLGVGTLLLVLLLPALLYQELRRPQARRAPLVGYRFRQVGVRPGTLRWILAYRPADGQAELLFQPADTSHGWQHHALGVDSARARAIALDWGGKVLLVGDNGTVQVYDSLLRPVEALPRALPPPPTDPAQQPQLVSRQRPSVVVDKRGQVAVVITEAGQVYRTNNGGRDWVRRPLPVLPASFPASALSIAREPIETGVYVSSDSAFAQFRFVTRQGAYHIFIPTADTTNREFIDESAQNGFFYPWHTPLRASAVWCGLGATGSLLAVDRLGNWVGHDTSGTDIGARAFFRNITSAAQLDSTGAFLGVSPTQLFQQSVKLLAAAARPFAGSSTGKSVTPKLELLPKSAIKPPTSKSSEVGVTPRGAAKNPAAGKKTADTNSRPTKLPEALPTKRPNQTTADTVPGSQRQRRDTPASQQLPVKQAQQETNPVSQQPVSKKPRRSSRQDTGRSTTAM
ncbi:hypothetical protein H8B15_13295 [Hymenobacter sp. BT507]|uniref:WD40 repeat domain-containing protein n=1 Tax=Hymenobacter citatus TaxID=2763506 RepID=A0ABR7MLD1_9BACT|nr:hypothetical protein [Hymenobacter citatus]MBC6611903.1 hypothetical protein [Hymenobacter citatus]